MRTKAGADAHRLERLARAFPPLALLVLLALAALLLVARSAHATAQAPPPTAPLALEGEGEGEFEEELQEEACEEAEEGLEEGELGEAEVEAICEEANGEGPPAVTASGSSAADRCPLRSAHARAVTLAKGRRLKVTVGYTTYEPTGATVDIRLGATRVGSFRRRLGRSGVLRIVRRLGKRPAPRRLVVRLRIAGSQRECSGAQTQRVRILQRAG
jgi:hypothetical protein